MNGSEIDIVGICSQNISNPHDLKYLFKPVDQNKSYSLDDPMEIKSG